MTLGIAINILDFWPETFGQGGRRRKKRKVMQLHCNTYEYRDIFMHIYFWYKLQRKGKPTRFRHLNITPLRTNNHVKYTPTSVPFKLESCLVWSFGFLSPKIKHLWDKQLPFSCYCVLTISLQATRRRLPHGVIYEPYSISLLLLFMPYGPGRLQTLCYENKSGITSAMGLEPSRMPTSDIKYD